MYPKKQGGLSKKTLLLIGVAMIAVIVGIMVFKILSKDNTDEQAKTQYVSVKKSGIAYPSSWTEANQIAVNEKESGVTSIATKDSPTIRVIVRQVPGALAPNFDISKLPDEIASQLQDEIDGFTLTSKGTTKYGASDAVKIEYSQLNSADQKVYEFTMFIVPAKDKTYYVTYSSDEGISKIESDITKINQAIADYIK